MRIKGEHIKKDKPLISGKLYQINASRTIEFEEKDTEDVVNIIFLIKDNQYGIYGNEFKPSFVGDVGGKKADILVLVIDEDKRRLASWIIDVKKSVGGEDVIYHLVEQLLESIKHKQSITTYMDDFEETQHIGYITRDLQKDRIQDTIAKKSDYLEAEKAALECLPTLIKKETQLRLLKEEAKLNLLINFQNDCIKNGKDEIHIEHYISKKKENKFVYDLSVSA